MNKSDLEFLSCKITRLPDLKPEPLREMVLKTLQDFYAADFTRNVIGCTVADGQCENCSEKRNCNVRGIFPDYHGRGFIYIYDANVGEPAVLVNETEDDYSIKTGFIKKVISFTRGNEPEGYFERDFPEKNCDCFTMCGEVVDGPDVTFVWGGEANV